MKIRTTCFLRNEMFLLTLFALLGCLVPLSYSQDLGPVKNTESSKKQKSRAKKDKNRKRYSKEKQRPKKFNSPKHINQSPRKNIGNSVASPSKGGKLGNVQTVYPGRVTRRISKDYRKEGGSVIPYRGSSTPGTVQTVFPGWGAFGPRTNPKRKLFKPNSFYTTTISKAQKRLRGKNFVIPFTGVKAPGKVQTFYGKPLNKRSSPGSVQTVYKRRYTNPTPLGSVQTFYGSMGKGTRQPTTKPKPVYLPRELFYPGPVDIFHINKPLPFTRRSWRADKQHQRKMDKVYVSDKAVYLSQEQQRKSALRYSRQLYKNYHKNPNLRIERMAQEDQMKRAEAYSKAIWNSYGKKPSTFERMQKGAAKRRKKLKKAFEKPIEHKLSPKQENAISDAAGFSNFRIPLKIQIIRKSSAFKVKGAKKHYIPYQPTQIGLFISPNTNPQTKLNPKYLKKRKRLKYDKGEARMWRELDDTTRGRGESGGGGEAEPAFDEGIDYEYDPDLELQDDEPLDEDTYEEPPEEEEEGEEDQ